MMAMRQTGVGNDSGDRDDGVIKRNQNLEMAPSPDPPETVDECEYDEKGEDEGEGVRAVRI